MITENFDKKKWKNEQVKYFKKYLNNFQKNSTEYRIIKKGIADLENI